jgi:hypothetical protein
VKRRIFDAPSQSRIPPAPRPRHQAETLGVDPGRPGQIKRSTFTAPVKLVTWNVNSLEARLPRVLELLAEHAP